MTESSLGVAPGVRSGERAIHVNSPAARWMGALTLLGAAVWLIAAVVRGHDRAGWHATGRLEWSLTVLAAVALVARGVFLGRPVTARHATTAAIVLFGGIATRVLSFDLVGDALIAGSGLTLMWPSTARRAARRPVSDLGADQRNPWRPAGAVRHASG